jgi:flagellar biosynthesis protein FlhF
MEILVERGVSYGDCVHKIVQKYGIYYHILKKKEYRSPGFLGLFPRDVVEVEFYLSPKSGIAWQSTPSDPVSAKLPQNSQVPAISPASDDTTLDFIEAKKRVLAAAGKNPEQVIQHAKKQEDKEVSEQKILEKLQEIQEQLGSKSGQVDHPSLVRIVQMLRQNDFSERYIAGLLERARKELPLEILENFIAVQDRVLDWIGESIKIFNIPQNEKSGRIMVLVGPTGVGKTTTIAKLAAIYGIENSGRRSLSVRMITIDAFRIGAKKQIEDFGDIMEIPVSYIDNRRDLRRELDLFRDETDIILVDTIGRSPRDSVKLGEMKELLDACGSKAEIHLVLSASTKASDIEHVMQQFEPFNYQAVLLTKLDETRHVGNIISALAEKEKPVSYVTDGQIVPKDIKKASVVRFLINLDEFRVDREEIEKRFPALEADQIQWG